MTLVQQEPKYIVMGYSYLPNEHTLAYYPFNSKTQLTDQSGNNDNWTKEGSWTPVYWTIGSIWYVTMDNCYMSATPMIDMSWDFTISYWINNVSGRFYWVQQFNHSTGGSAVAITSDFAGISIWGKGDDRFGIASMPSGWVNIVLTYTPWTMKLYLNNTLVWTKSRTVNTATPDYFWVNTAGELSNHETYSWIYSELIIEDKEWTDDERTAYFNQAKWNYWIS